MKDKDKEKQIEEMAKEIAKKDCYFYDKCNRNPKHNCISLNPKIRLDSDKNYITIATWLVNADYRKIDKDSVILSREEYEILKVKEKEKYWLETCMSLWNNAKIYGRNETTEKIYKLVDNKLELYRNGVISGNLYDVGYQTAIYDIKRIIKELRGE